jgi:hypothetical protein
MADSDIVIVQPLQYVWENFLSRSDAHQQIHVAIVFHAPGLFAEYEAFSLCCLLSVLARGDN